MKRIVIATNSRMVININNLRADLMRYQERGHQAIADGMRRVQLAPGRVIRGEQRPVWLTGDFYRSYNPERVAFSNNGFSSQRIHRWTVGYAKFIFYGTQSYEAFRWHLVFYLLVGGSEGLSKMMQKILKEETT